MLTAVGLGRGERGHTAGGNPDQTPNRRGPSHAGGNPDQTQPNCSGRTQARPDRAEPAPGLRPGMTAHLAQVSDVEKVGGVHFGQVGTGGSEA
ncbi:hypothetical protein SKAU_G00162370 [Synaphobranchus kaupii]|uniref:Uncharacterized protein n=1 Tax=Synaphobranchus kaupii TaxID=118154 RepID=A0A9Q1FJ90_SYNKA|nr:hypothetical protein SKAU_G00162370 [Synaphobranchus kaupii]